MGLEEIAVLTIFAFDIQTDFGFKMWFAHNFNTLVSNDNGNML